VAEGDGEGVDDDGLADADGFESSVLPVYVPQPASMASEQTIAAVAILIRGFTDLPMSTVTL
jgi:hypothetical protein